MTDYNKITQGEFDQCLAELLDAMSGEGVLSIPGVYEAVSEELNNETLDLAMAKFHPADQ